jgi:hypothetical protein
MITFVDVMTCQFKSLLTSMKIDITLLERGAEISKTQIRMDKVFFQINSSNLVYKSDIYSLTREIRMFFLIEETKLKYVHLTCY